MLTKSIERTNITGSRSKQQQIKRHCRYGINEEPAFDVVNGDLVRVRDDFAVVQVGRAEVGQDVGHEHHVHYEVDYDEVISLAIKRTFI